MIDQMQSSSAQDPLSNGLGAAAILAAGIGCFAVGLFAVLADAFPAFKNLMVFYRPTGPLSGVTTLAIALWLVSWAVLDWRWKHASVRLPRITLLAFSLLIFGLLLTFPPIAALF